MYTNGLDRGNGEDWREYCFAARRKIDIAEYHLERLRAVTQETPIEPTVPVQAHLEGILFAFVAAADQTAEAINLGLGLNLDKPQLRDALEKMPHFSVRSQLFKWHDAPIANDVRNVRRRAAHHHYAKVPGGPRLEVQEPTIGVKPYGGRRDVVSYGEAAVAHIRRLGEILDRLQSGIERRISTPRASQ